MPTDLVDINCDAAYPTQQTLTASDACGTASVVGTDDIPANPDYCAGFTVTYTWTATDECGNTAVVTRSFDVLPDTGDPTFDQVPTDLVDINCDAAYPTQQILTASDACGTASVVGTDDIPANPDYCAGFTVTYTWTATDECGNSAVVTRSFDVLPDTSDPTFDQVPTDLVDINCDAAYPTQQTLTASDACGTASVVGTDDIPANPDYCAGFTVTYTWTATDECGNTASVQRSFDVLPDTGDPTFDQVPTDLVDINCDAAYPTQQTLTASDACGTASVVGTDDIPANPDYCAGFYGYLYLDSHR